MAETLLSISHLRKAFGPRILFDDVSLGIQSGERLGLIGDNGTGKSTFLKVLLGREPADAGHVALRQGTQVVLLEQVPTFTESTVEEALQEPFAAVRQAIDDYERAATGGHDTSDALLRIDSSGGWEWQHNLERAASIVGLNDLHAPINSLSGGQQKRLALAKVILQKPDLLLLDEPTNHLDTQTVEWMESWLSQSSMAVVVVTHDRYFLEAVVDRMSELRGGSLRTYVGSYADYIEARATEEALQQRIDNRRAQVLKAEVEWARRSPKARSTKQRARLDRVDEARDRLARSPKAAAVADLRLAEAPRLGKTILAFENATASFGDQPLFQPFSLDLRAGERWGIVGPNGAGKTTLLRLAIGAMQPSAGVIKRGINTQVAYFDQHRTALDESLCVRDMLLPEGGDTVRFNGRSMHVSSYLNRYAFAPAAHAMRIAELSGGEKNRLALALFMLAPANVLALDEPTNDLDILTLSILEDALLEFAGCVLVVSHDRYFLDKVCTGIVGFAASAQSSVPALTAVQGSWTSYSAREIASARPQPPSPKSPSAPAPALKSQAGAKLSAREQRELDGIEARLMTAEAEVTRLQESLADPTLWSGDGASGKSAQQALALAQQQIAALYQRWEALTERT